MKTLIVIEGPTASGKTDVAVEIAKYFNTEIVSADSRQIYKEMTIGTAVPSAETLSQIKHHLIQTRSVTEYYNVYNFEQEALDIIENQIFSKNDYAILCGGSMLYIDAVCKGIDLAPDPDPTIRQTIWNRYYNGEFNQILGELKSLDPDYYNNCDTNNYKRIIHALEMCLTTGKPFSSFKTGKPKQRNFKIVRIGLNLDREILYNRINIRVDWMMENGLLEEVNSLQQYKNLNALNTVGYRELFDYIDGKTDLATAVQLIKRNTRHYARKQITWFKKDLHDIWHSPFEINSILKTILL